MISRKFVLNKNNTHYFLVEKIDYLLNNSTEYLVTSNKEYSTVYSQTGFNKEFAECPQYSISSFLDRAHMQIVSTSNEILSDEKKLEILLSITEFENDLNKGLINRNKNIYNPNLTGIKEKFLKLLDLINKYITYSNDDFALEVESGRARKRNGSEKK